MGPMIKHFLSVMVIVLGLQGVLAVAADKPQSQKRAVEVVALLMKRIQKDRPLLARRLVTPHLLAGEPFNGSGRALVGLMGRYLKPYETVVVGDALLKSSDAEGQVVKYKVYVDGLDHDRIFVRPTPGEPGPHPMPILVSEVECERTVAAGYGPAPDFGFDYMVFVTEYSGFDYDCKVDFLMELMTSPFPGSFARTF